MVTQKKEQGNAINYVMAYIVLIVALTVTMLLINQQEILLAKQEIENGIQICESFVLADTSRALRLDETNRLFDRQQIITAYEYNTENPNLTYEEAQQVSLLSQKYVAQIRKYFNLDALGYPQNTVLSEIGNSKLLIEDFIIYEAVYDVNKNIVGFIQYKTAFNGNNDYVSCSAKKYLSTDLHINGVPLYGSTIYSALSYEINVFGKLTKSIKIPVIVDIVPQESYQMRSY